MKRFTVIMMTAVCMLSLAACGSRQPSIEEVEKAIADGNVTVEDALEKGWVSQAWVEDYYEKNSVDAANKSEVFSLGEFSTKTVSGEPYTSDSVSDATYLAFFEPSHADAKEFFKNLCEANAAVEENGGRILAFSMSESGTELFENAPFPVLLYNDSVGEALPEGAADFIKEILAELPFTANWYADGYLQTAWNSSIDADELAQLAKSFSAEAPEDNSDSGDNGQAAGRIG